jgi:hypothetical protein
MSTRRAQLALGLGLIAGPLAMPSTAQATPKQLEVYARRRQITLPNLPALGLTYIATFDLTDAAGTPIGEGFANNSIVDVTLAGPVVLSQVVLRLTDGEVHYERIIKRFGDYPRSSTGAILGGTGAYATASGDAQIVWPDKDTIKITLNLAN